MVKTLFSNPRYTIDTSSFNQIFDEDRNYNRKNFPSLWEKLSGLLTNGEIVSHMEVYEEIQQGSYDDLKKWTETNRYVFWDYSFPKEGEIVSEIGDKFSAFILQGKTKPNHADPWLVAQAKLNNLTVITEETDRDLQIPVVCRELGVPCLSLFGLVKAERWSF